ncbi:MAG: hypothetical protein ABIK07_03445, partial [Planctomycetota bacterium]
MLTYLKLIAVIPFSFMLGCNPQGPEKSITDTKSGGNVTAQKSEQTEVVEVKEKEILKPGKLQVELPEDIPLPDSASVAMGPKLDSS